MAPWDGQINSNFLQTRLNYDWPSSASKILLELYRDGYLRRTEGPKTMYVWGRKPTGGHRYFYSLTTKGKKKLKWIKQQGYSLKKRKKRNGKRNVDSDRGYVIPT